MIYTKTELKRSVFIKINAIPQEEYVKDVPEIWNEKYLPKYFNESKDVDYVENVFLENAYLHPEFSKVHSMSFGVFEEDMSIAVDVLTGDDEKTLLTNISTLLDKVSDNILAGYNIGSYDIPFLIRRMIVNKVKLPFLLELKGKKPWEIFMNDVMRDYQSSIYEPICLDLLLKTFGINNSTLSDKQINIGYIRKKITEKNIKDNSITTLTNIMNCALYMMK